MQIEVWSDVVCPWCFIGKRRLERALVDTGLSDVEVVHRAFQLDPHATTEGRRTVEVIASKYGTDVAGAEQMMGQVTAVARGEGLSYQLLDTTSGNTELAHEVLLWAQDQDHDNNHHRGQELLERLYSAYFERAEPIFTLDEILPHVEAVGLDVDEARAAIDSGVYRARVAEDGDLARQFGANGVPFFVFHRRYGISGAQPLEAFVQTLLEASSTGTDG
jgi:predicted DsbA family dithiol-disulfide isomerase